MLDFFLCYSVGRDLGYTRRASFLVAALDALAGLFL